MADLLTSNDDPFALPPPEIGAALQTRGLLPKGTRDSYWRLDRSLTQPRPHLALVQLSPRQPFQAGGGNLVTLGPLSYASGSTVHPGELSFRNTGGFEGITYFSFENLGANRTCIAWFDLLVSGPASSSLKLSGTGNPSSLVITKQATGGVRSLVPLVITATSDGRAYANLFATQVNDSGAWYGTTVHAL